MLEFSLLCLQRLDLEGEMKKIHNHLDSIHLDIMDGEFVPPTAFSTNFVDDYKTSLKKHVHVMSYRPEEFFDELNNITSFSFHIEALKNPKPLLEKIRSQNIQPGLVVSPQTNIEKVFQYLELVDRIILMAVDPGYSAQSFIPETSKKIIKLRKQDKNVEIVIDGGMNEDTMREVLSLGANECVVCSVIVKSDNPIEKIKSLKSSGKIGLQNNEFLNN
tara:strand:+ start:29 stop:682 length:654 start_codon:yes stop_codon:yes gene_type:complete